MREVQRPKKEELLRVRQQIREKAFQLGHGDYRNLAELKDVFRVLDGLAEQLQKRYKWWKAHTVADELSGYRISEERNELLKTLEEILATLK